MRIFQVALENETSKSAMARLGLRGFLNETSCDISGVLSDLLSSDEVIQTSPAATGRQVPEN